MRYRGIVIGVVALLISVAWIARGESRNVRLSGHIVGASGKYAIHVALWRREGFLVHAAQEMRLAPGGDGVFKFDVAPGWWSVSAFEDKNGNGILDMGMFGPKEPNGFWRVFTGWHKPTFDEVAVQVDKDTTNADITLK